MTSLSRLFSCMTASTVVLYFLAMSHTCSPESEKYTVSSAEELFLLLLSSSSIAETMRFDSTEYMQAEIISSVLVSTFPSLVTEQLQAFM